MQCYIWEALIRSSHLRFYVKKVLLKISQKWLSLITVLTYSFHKCSSPSNMRSIISFIVTIFPNSSLLLIVHTFGVLLLRSDWICSCLSNSNVVTFLGIILLLNIASGLIIYLTFLYLSLFVKNNAQFALLNALNVYTLATLFLYYFLYHVFFWSI